MLLLISIIMHGCILLFIQPKKWASALSQLWFNRIILTLVANSVYSVKCLLLLLPPQFSPGKVENLRLSPHPHLVSLFSSHLLGAWTRSGMQVLLPALQLQWRRGCADEFVWAWAWCLLPVRQLQEQGKGSQEGRAGVWVLAIVSQVAAW